MTSRPPAPSAQTWRLPGPTDTQGKTTAAMRPEPVADPLRCGVPVLTGCGPLTQAATAVIRLAAEQADQAEHDCQHSPALIAALRTAGFSRHFAPVNRGGGDSTFADYVQAIMVLGRVDASVAWCAAVAANTTRMATFLPADGQAAVWGTAPDTMLAGALMPSGTAEPVDGGWLLTGAWPYLSGIHYADGALVSCRVPIPNAALQVRLLFVPRDRFARVERTWTSIGMRATGSDTLVLHRVFVPIAHTLTNTDLMAGTRGSDPVGVPHMAVSGLAFAGPLVGGARGALDAWLRLATAPGRAIDDAHRMIASRSAAEIDTAELLLRNAAETADRDTMTAAKAAQAHRDHALAAELATTAVNRLFTTAGTRGGTQTEVLQRHWRDVNTAAAHPALQFRLAAHDYAALLLPDPPRPAVDPT